MEPSGVPLGAVLSLAPSLHTVLGGHMIREGIPGRLLRALPTENRKSLSELQALVQLIQKNWGKEHKTQRKKHTHTHTIYIWQISGREAGKL